LSSKTGGFDLDSSRSYAKLNFLCFLVCVFWPTLTIETNGGSQSKNWWRAGRLVEGILAAKRTGDEFQVAALEAKIDEHVFRLYALTPPKSP
jgi:hypothetical protein